MLTITKQPEDVTATVGSSYTLRVEAKGTGLSYAWYYKAAGAAEFTRSSVTAASYTNTMRLNSDGMELYCEVKDAYGTVERSNTRS